MNEKHLFCFAGTQSELLQSAASDIYDAYQVMGEIDKLLSK